MLTRPGILELLRRQMLRVVVVTSSSAVPTRLNLFSLALLAVHASVFH